MSLVALAHLFITLVRKDLRKEIPALSLDRTVRLLQAALRLRHLDEDHAVRLVHYYVHGTRSLESHMRKPGWNAGQT